MKITVLDGGVLNPGDVSWQPLAELGELTVYDATLPEEVAARVAGAEIVLVNKTPLGGDNIADLAACRLVGALATGVNNLELPALAKAGIKVCNVPAYGVEDVAQHALALMLELARATGQHTAGVLAGDWNGCGEWCYWRKTPRSLSGLILGIIGFGGIGRALGGYGHALGMNILASSRTRNAVTEYPFTWAEPAELWQKADVISLHCPFTEETAKIVDAKNLAQMKPGGYIINTARGGLVDEEAVAAALHSGKLAGFAADVLSVEPPAADNPLLSAPNVLITPHMAWATTRARQNIIDIMAANVQGFLAGRPRNLV